MSRDPEESKYLRMFGKRLAEIRHSRGHTQESLAERAGVSALTVAYIEQGRQWPRITTMLKIAKSLNIEALELLRGIK